MIQSFDDMEDTQQAYREAGAETQIPPSQAPPPKKKGPAVQAPPAPKPVADR